MRRDTQRNIELTKLAGQLTSEREARARRRGAERARIARERHDAAAHTVSVMTIQTGGVRRRLDADPDEFVSATSCSTSSASAGRLSRNCIVPWVFSGQDRRSTVMRR